jgi:cytochrome b
MSRTLVWDLPVRLAHWLLALLFLGAFGLATLSPDDAKTFPLHAVLGLTAVFLVALRLIWGFVGTRYARFRSFQLRPGALVDHFWNAQEPTAGHNPATSWFALLLFAGLAGLGVTGFRIARGDERLADLHEVLAWSVLGLVALHLAGLLVHYLRTRENLAVSMIDGQRAVAAAVPIRSERPGAAFLLIALVGVFGALVASGYEVGARRVTLPLIGTQLSFAELEEGLPTADEDFESEDEGPRHQD